MNIKEKMYYCGCFSLFAGTGLWLWYAFCIWLSFLSGRTYTQTSFSLTQDFNLFSEMIFELFFVPFISILLLISNIYLVVNLNKETKNEL